MKKYNLKVIALLLIFVSLASSCREVKNILKAIDKYGYKSKTPLGAKDIPIDKLLIGCYVYKSIPIIITEKDSFTYNLKFLTTELDEKDIEIEAFLSVIGNSKYLNLDMGYSFSFLKINDVSIMRDVEVKLIKNTITRYVDEKNLAKWLLKHDGKDDFKTDDSLTIDIYYTFNFYKITEEKAYKIQADALQDKKEQLFTACNDYETYKTLSAKYAGDPALSKARETLFNKCVSIEDYKAFVSYFGNDALSEKAKSIILKKTLFVSDSLAFNKLLGNEDVKLWIEFIDSCATPLFKDSAQKLLKPLIDNITEEKIAWKWHGGEKIEAIKLIFYKIDFTPESINKAWFTEHLTLYCLQAASHKHTEEALLYLDKLAMGSITKDELLDLYMSKGFLLWHLGKFEPALDVFKSKIKEVYNNKADLTFRKNITQTYKSYQKEGILFPDEKAMWKRVKKVK